MNTFEFAWKQGLQNSGKVFAKKRNPTKKVTALTGSTDTDVRNSKPLRKKNTDDRSSNVKKPTVENTDDAYTYIKRKRRKDKLISKSTKDEIESNPVNTATPTNPTHSLFSVRHKELYVKTNIPGKSVVEKVFSVRKFSDLNVHKYVIANLEKCGYRTLTKVQEKAFPDLLAGKNVLIRSQTGSGKTLAYAVPIIDALQAIDPRLKRQDGVQAIIVVPTRELALQTHELFGKINTFQWLVISHLCGGENRKTEKDRLRKGVHVVIGTPGRLLDHILHTTAFKLDNVRCLVLDEADRLLDMGFKKDIIKIVEELERSKVNSEYDPIALLKGIAKDQENDMGDDGTEVPLRNVLSKNRQTVLLSATLNKNITELADFTMKDHIYIHALDDSSNISTDHMVIPNTVTQEFIMTYAKHKLFTLAAVLVAKEKQKIFVFMATSQMVDFHYELFTKYLVKLPKNRGKDYDVAVDSDDEEEIVLESEIFKLHGSMDQSMRKDVFTRFRKAKRGVLLCTDVATRGVDVPEADCVIQYTGPQTDEDYLHRVGRTGRAGKSGSALIFLTYEEQEYLVRLQEQKVFLKEHKSDDFLKHLCILMEENDQEKAATALQHHFEAALSQDKECHRLACFAYSTWTRFYNTYPGKMRTIFNFKNINLGHYVTSFGLKETPSNVARIVRGQVEKVEPRRLNKKLTIHQQSDSPVKSQKRKIQSISLSTSEFSSGLAPTKKKHKK